MQIWDSIRARSRWWNEPLKFSSAFWDLNTGDTLSSTRLLATILRISQRYDDSEKLIRQTLATERRVLGPEDPETLSSMNALVATLGGEGRFSEQEELERETLAIQQRVLGPEHPATLVSMDTLADALTNEGLYEEAEKLQREALDIQRRVFGPQDLRTLSSMSNLAWDSKARGQIGRSRKRPAKRTRHRAPRARLRKPWHPLWSRK